MIKHQIVSLALKIRRYLDQKGGASVAEIKSQFKVREPEIYLALGWMACENKIYLRFDGQELYAIV